MIRFNDKEQLRIYKCELLREVEQRLDLNANLTDDEKLYRYRLVEETLNEFIERISKK